MKKFLESMRELIRLGEKRNKMKDFFPKEPLIFDVGANCGKKTGKYLNLGASRVVCVEPQVSCLQILKNKYGGDPRVCIEPYCLSDVKGSILLYINPDNMLSSADLDWQKGRFTEANWGNDATEVQSTTLDELIGKYGKPDFCKIDVEGFELNVLKGLSTLIPYLSFEFTAEFMEKKTKPCLERLISIGYTKFNAMFGEKDRFIFKEWVDHEELLKNLINNPDKLLWGDIYARQ